ASLSRTTATSNCSFRTPRSPRRPLTMTWRPDRLPRPSSACSGSIPRNWKARAERTARCCLASEVSLLASLTVVAVACAVSAAQTQAATENLTFQSSTYSSFRQLLRREEPSARVDVPGRLSLSEVAGRMPAVVIVHTLAGYRAQNEGWQADALQH